MFTIEFLEIRAVDLIDIAIVAVILYRLYASMRGTIAAQIFLGLVVILVVSVISQFFEMRLLSWLLRTVGDIWVIALIILFQPELRRILLMLGRRGLLFGPNQDVDLDTVVDPLIEACEELSRRRYGALIVLSGTRDISATFDTGVNVDADLSSEMLLTIFNPKSPLHDGAVVVAGSRIESAGVILPFGSESSGHDARLGTRHRAGVGITQQADVFVLIVSEETGSISYARDGKLHYDRPTPEVRAEISRLIEAEQSVRQLPILQRIATILRTSQRKTSKGGKG